jgi:hypothetical protein
LYRLGPGSSKIAKDAKALVTVQPEGCLRLCCKHVHRHCLTSASSAAGSPPSRHAGARVRHCSRRPARGVATARPGLRRQHARGPACAVRADYGALQDRAPLVRRRQGRPRDGRRLSWRQSRSARLPGRVSALGVTGCPADLRKPAHGLLRASQTHLRVLAAPRFDSTASLCHPIKVAPGKPRAGSLEESWTSVRSRPR